MIAVGGLLIYGIYFFALIKLIPVTMTLPGIAGPDPHDRCRGRREHRDLRANKGGDPRRKIGRLRDRDRLQARLCGDRRRERRDVHDRLHPVRARDGRSQGLRVHARDRHARVAVHRRARDPGRARRRWAARRFVTHRWALGAERHGRGWTFDFMGASKWFFSLSGTILLIGALAIGGKGLNLGIDFKSGTRIQTALRQASVSETPGRRSDVRAPATPTPRSRNSATRASAAPATRSRPRRCSRRRS